MVARIRMFTRTNTSSQLPPMSFGPNHCSLAPMSMSKLLVHTD